MRDDAKTFIELFARAFEPPGPILEIGSLQTVGQEGYADLRAFFPGKAYTGCDLIAGPGVDRVTDAAALDLPDGSVGTVVAADSLEHVADPWRAAAEMRRVLAPGGLCAITAPFVFPIHHPPDFTRFTPEGMAWLLRAFAVVSVFSLGDAQWPHAVCAIAARSGGSADDFGAGCVRLLAAWDAAGRFDVLLPFSPVTSIARHDTGDVLLTPLGGTRVVTQELDCSADGLCRVDVKLDAEGEREGRQVGCTIADARTGEQLAWAATRVRPPVRGRWVAFQFPAIAGSAGRRLAIRVTSPEGSAGARIVLHVAREGTLSFEALVRRAR
jgi:SAM-dependent methyltransferase